jgi:hypothetical protein
MVDYTLPATTTVCLYLSQRLYLDAHRKYAYPLTEVTRSRGRAVCSGKSVRQKEIDGLATPFSCTQCVYNLPKKGQGRCQKGDFHLPSLNDRIG